MRAWLVPLLVLLAGCMDDYHHGCWDDGAFPMWTEHGLYAAALADGWDMDPVTPTVDSELVAELGGNASTWRIEHHWSETEWTWWGTSEGSRMGGIIDARRGHAGAAGLIEEFARNSLGYEVTGADYILPGERGTEVWQLRGEAPSDANVDRFLGMQGDWLPDAPGYWGYWVGESKLHVRIPVAHADNGVLVDAADRVLGPYVQAPFNQTSLQAAASQAFAELGLPAPGFADFAHEAQRVCT